MTVVSAIVLFLLAHGASLPVHALALERPSFGNYGNNANSHPTPPPHNTQSTQERARNSQKMKERALSMLQKFTERLDRYEEFIGKVSSRKQKLADKGVDVSNINAFISTGTSNLAAARAALETARTAVSAIDTSGDPQSVRTTIHTQLEAVRTAMRRLHTSMSEAVRAARQATAAGAGGRGGAR